MYFFKKKNFFKTLFFLIVINLFSHVDSLGDTLKKIEVNGNVRISNETIISFLDVKINDIIKDNNVNDILKDLYKTNFFSDIKIKFLNNTLIIDVIENPIINQIFYNNVKSDELLRFITEDIMLFERSPYVENNAEDAVLYMLDRLKKRGYYFSKIYTSLENLEDDKINLIFNIDLGNKAKIKKISFIGEKIFKDRELRNIILSEQYRFWKFLSGKKYLNEELVSFDIRLLKNFFLNKGYYNVKISSSYAKLLDEDEFELIYNIDAGEKIFFGDLSIDLPINYDEKDFEKLNKILSELKDEPYSIYAIEKITDEINSIALYEQYETINIDVSEIFTSDKINLNFEIKETDKKNITRINIYGNNITRESVLRNQFEIDEGDIFNEILYKKTIDNLKSLNFFKNVDANVTTGENLNDTIIDIEVEEKATGEIGASAGVGTSGSSVGFFVKENNYLGKGIGLESNLTISEDSVKGLFAIKNPNYNDSDKSVYARIEASETNRLKDFGYKTSRTGFALGTNFEILDDFNFGLGNKIFHEKIEVDNNASALQKKQKGNYFDTFLNLDFDYDKRNQKFKTSDGHRTFYSLDIPLISETNTLTNTFQYTMYSELYDNNITSFSYFAKTSNSLTNDNVKLSERVTLPSNKLRGFVQSKIGPKDGGDYIGGNFANSFNIKSTLPKILKDSQNIDISAFLDVASIWGIDYDSSIDDSNELRSSIGLGADWFTVVGPLNFSLALPLTKADTDKTETFRFNLGTTF